MEHLENEISSIREMASEEINQLLKKLADITAQDDIHDGGYLTSNLFGVVIVIGVGADSRLMTKTLMPNGLTFEGIAREEILRELQKLDAPRLYTALRQLRGFTEDVEELFPLG